MADVPSPTAVAVRASRSRLVVVGALGLTTGLVVGLVAALVVRAGGDDDESDDRAGADSPAAERASSTMASSSTTTTRPTTTTAPPRQDVVSDDGALRMSLPEGWVWTTVSGDMTGRGAELFPNRYPMAAFADQVFATLLTPQTRFVAMEGDDAAAVQMTEILLVESGPANVGQQEAYEAAKQASDVSVQQEGRIQTAVGEAGWFDFSAPGVPEMVGRRFVLVHNGTAWLLTFWSGNMALEAPVADEILVSFAPA